MSESAAESANLASLTELKRQAKNDFVLLSEITLSSINSGLDEEELLPTGITDMLDFRAAWRTKVIDTAETQIAEQLDAGQLADINQRYRNYQSQEGIYQNHKRPPAIEWRLQTNQLNAVRRLSDALATGVDTVCALITGSKQLAPNLTSAERLAIIIHPQSAAPIIEIATHKIEDFIRVFEPILFIKDSHGVLDGLNLMYWYLENGHIALIDGVKPLLSQFRLGKVSVELANRQPTTEFGYTPNLGGCPIVHRDVRPHFNKLVQIMAADAYKFGLLE